MRELLLHCGTAACHYELGLACSYLERGGTPVTFPGSAAAGT